MQLASQSPTQTRSERFCSENPSDFPEPSNRDLAWKYAPIPIVENFLSKDFYPYEYHISLAGSDAGNVKPAIDRPIFRWSTKENVALGRAGLPEDRTSAFAWQRTQRVLLVDLEGAESIILDRRFERCTVAHTIIHVKAHADAKLFINNHGYDGLIENLEIILEDNAILQLISCQDWDEASVHLAYHFVYFGKNSRLKHCSATTGGRFVRLNPAFQLAEEGSEVESLGIYFAQNKQHFEHQVYVHHAAQDTKSEINYRGVLSGNGARTAWVGDVLIDTLARNSDSYEQNRNLMIGSGTRADSVPNLEIKNGNILGAGHASATMRFDDEHLFYLQSRGIDKNQALRMVVSGFVHGMLQKSDIGCGGDVLLRLFSKKLDALVSCIGD
ncbi:SufB/SufD family protein [Tropheryma whipplei]|uniref:SufB/SufD family protein n=1 Tax=Tropheryma whipplei TaxID=2039 RepID=UPI0002E4F6A4|nr:SufD family Fe-S cluster assembly protein [Tropheryma whipplei]